MPDVHRREVVDAFAGEPAPRGILAPRATVSRVTTVDAGDKASAKTMLERALSEKRILEVAFEERRLEVGIRTLLAQILLEEKDQAGAQKAAAPACALGPGGAVPESLASLGLCK